MSGMHFFLGFPYKNNVSAFTFALQLATYDILINMKYITFIHLKEEIYFIVVPWGFY